MKSHPSGTACGANWSGNGGVDETDDYLAVGGGWGMGAGGAADGDGGSPGGIMTRGLFGQGFGGAWAGDGPL